MRALLLSYVIGFQSNSEDCTQIVLSDVELPCLQDEKNQQCVLSYRKSFILEDALQTLRRMYGQDAVFVTAPTGLAACALGGTTVHAFSGAGIIGDNESTAKIVDKVRVFVCTYCLKLLGV